MVKIIKAFTHKILWAKHLLIVAGHSYHRQTEIPIIKILLSDDAPQFKKLTFE